jgi:hypothetical protein
MAVRAEFKVNSVESTLRQIPIDATADHPAGYRFVEMRTIAMSPVYSSDPNSENKKFWDASPSGELKLGTVNAAAWEQFELGGEYYIDFIKAD